MNVQYLFETLLSVLLDIYPEAELLGHMVIISLIFLRDLCTSFHSICTILHFYLLLPRRKEEKETTEGEMAG